MTSIFDNVKDVTDILSFPEETSKPKAPAIITNAAPEWALSEDTLRKRAPAIFAAQPDEQVSDRYGFVSTHNLIDEFAKEGWYPTSVSQSWPRKGQLITSARHMVRLRKHDTKFTEVGDCLPEIVVDNSHNRTSKFRLNAGLFRLVCSNGLVVGDTMFHAKEYRHDPDAMAQVIEGAYEVIETVPAITDNIRKYNGLLLGKDERLQLARNLMTMIFNEEIADATDLEAAITPQREEDKRASLWNTFNILQERVEKGGIVITQKRRAETKGMASPASNIATNKALWEMMEQTYESKKAS